MNEIVARDQPNHLAPEAIAEREPETLLSVIYRAATDPKCDLDRMERLFAMHREMESQAREREFNTAMSKAQSKMRAIIVDKTNLQTRSDYASYFIIDKAIRPIYSEYGFALSYSTKEMTSPDWIRVICHVTHSGGFARDYDIPMPADGKGAKGGDVMTKTHALGSAATYGMRYLLKMIFNLAIGAKEDDDGNGAGAGPCITAEQISELRTLLESVRGDEQKFLAHMKIGALSVMPAKDFSRAVAAIEAKRARAL